MSSLSTQRRLHDGLLVDLKCPLTLDFFVDPITVPCCGKSFEREELVEHLRNNLTCPCCNGDLSHYDAQNQAKNVVLAALVETLQQLQAGGAEAAARATTPKEHAWSCTATPIIASSTMCEVVLNLQNARFQTRPALFIAVLDRSGSMGGQPHAQVLAALKHIESLAAHNAHVRLVMLTYGDDCKEITKAADYIIAGGTNFRAAFAMVNTVLQRYICSDDQADAERANNVSMATVVLMTDGQDCSGNRQTLVPEFKEMLVARWGDKPLAVHTVGFSGGCDRELLESIRTAGTVEGLYRYAEPGDNDDALCQKLSGIFELSSNASTVPIRFHLLGVEKEHAVRLEVNATKHGSYRCWLDLVPGSQLTLSLSSAIDNDVRVPIRVLAPSEFVMQRWLTHLVDTLATEVLELSKRSSAVDGKPMTHNVRTLSCALLQKKIFAIRAKLADEHVRARLDYIAQQIEQLQCGQAVNVGKLSDLRFASLFAAPEPSGKSAGVALVSTQTLHTAPKQVDDKPFFERHMRCYSRNNDGTNRNLLQCAIMHQLTDRTSADVTRLLAEATIADVLHVDSDGNNTLMLAAYCGHARTVRFLLDKYGPNGTGGLDAATLARENLHGESAMTMAIKKRGYHFTIGALLDVGVQITRPKSLERYAIEQKYLITAQIIARVAEQQAAGAGESIAIKIDANAKPEFVQYMFERALASGGAAQWDPQQFLDVALGKQMTVLAKRLMVECGAKPTLSMLLDHCIPKKPDTPLYIELAQLVLDANPTLIAGKTSDDDDNETPLHRAVQRGSLPHVQLFAEQFAKRGISIDEPTAKGNTALWVAAFQCYPCIIDDLLDRGADVNRSNAKGNASLYGPCTRGNRKVAAQLIAAGACIEQINSNGDTLVLICCRNGHHEVLELLLTYVDETFVNRKAHIDGFNAIMACAEQDRADCIRVLHEYGIALDQQTDDDNQILKRASPLHIAAYYGRLAALSTLLQCGANPNIADLNGQTPLHIAVVQGNVDAIRLLRSKGADCTIADLSGNVPMAYTRDRKDVRKALIDPVLDILMLLARGGFAKEEELEACAILERHTGVIGCLSSPEIVDVRDFDGSTPLIQAVLHGRVAVAKSLLSLRADPLLCNAHGMSSVAWATWSKNARLQGIFSGWAKLVSAPHTTIVLKRLISASDVSASTAQVLFLGARPSDYIGTAQSGITRRMEEFISTPMLVESGDTAAAGNVVVLRIEDAKSWMPRKLDTCPTFDTHRTEVENRVWDAKVFAVNKIASLQKEEEDAAAAEMALAARQAFTLCLATSSATVFSIVNTAMLTGNGMDGAVRLYASALLEALQQMPPFVGEAFIGSSIAQRKMYTIGQTFRWRHFASASTLWKVALENAPYFTSSARRGVVFVVQSKTGRLVSTRSQFCSDAEVLFLPNTVFRVTNWYHGDIIALGQANIRAHTFGVKERDEERMPIAQLMESDKALIIELAEQ